ncbi:MAG TPA: cellulase family glycosylhydrolase [Terriglobales bacterium]|nr:cellulase family glycosylhydrolase [Terriglobales bacterium]
MIERPSPGLPTPDGASSNWVGVNFWSRAGGPRMWSAAFDEDVVRHELQILAEHGLNVTRSFFFLPDFMPAPYTIDEGCAERFDRFLDLSGEAGMGTIPTFVVGHMSGENWDVPWRQGRDLYRDGWMLARQAFFARAMAERFGGHPAVVGWLLSNEMPLYGGPTSAEYARSWTELLVQAVRAGGATQPVSTGDGAWGLEVTGHDNGFRIRDVAPAVDFLGPHVYPMSDDATRQHLAAAFTCELCHVGAPVVLEEFGCTTDFASGEHAADYYRQLLHTSLLAGAVGWIAWNNTDFDLTAQDPYRHHPFELHFGVTGTDGAPKPPLLELRRFRRLLDTVDAANCRRAPTDTAILVSSYLETDYPFFREEERRAVRDNTFQAYIAAHEAGLTPALAREVDGLPDARLLIVPSTKALTAPTWRALEDRACAGATVYISYFPGVGAEQRGPWWPNLDALFGVEHQLRYGLIQRVDEDAVTWRLVGGLGDLEVDAELSFRVAGTAHSRAMLPLVVPAASGTRVVAEDAHGRPALLVREVGAGALVLATYPVEHFAAALPNANPEATWRLYRALGARAGVQRAVGSDLPEVLVDRLLHRDGACYVWAVNTGDGPRSPRIELCGGGWLRDVETGEHADAEVGLPPHGVRVFQWVTT